MSLHLDDDADSDVEPFPDFNLRRGKRPSGTVGGLPPCAGPTKKGSFEDINLLSPPSDNTVGAGPRRDGSCNPAPGVLDGDHGLRNNAGDLRSSPSHIRGNLNSFCASEVNSVAESEELDVLSRALDRTGRPANDRSPSSIASEPEDLLNGSFGFLEDQSASSDGGGSGGGRGGRGTGRGHRVGSRIPRKGAPPLKKKRYWHVAMGVLWEAWVWMKSRWKFCLVGAVLSVVVAYLLARWCFSSPLSGEEAPIHMTGEEHHKHHKRAEQEDEPGMLASIFPSWSSETDHEGGAGASSSAGDRKLHHGGVLELRGPDDLEDELDRVEHDGGGAHSWRNPVRRKSASEIDAVALEAELEAVIHRNRAAREHPVETASEDGAPIIAQFGSAFGSFLRTNRELRTTLADLLAVSKGGTAQLFADSVHSGRSVTVVRKDHDDGGPLALHLHRNDATKYHCSLEYHWVQPETSLELCYHCARVRRGEEVVLDHGLLQVGEGGVRTNGAGLRFHGGAEEEHRHPTDHIILEMELNHRTGEDFPIDYDWSLYTWESGGAPGNKAGPMQLSFCERP